MGLAEQQRRANYSAPAAAQDRALFRYTLCLVVTAAVLLPTILWARHPARGSRQAQAPAYSIRRPPAANRPATPGGLAARGLARRISNRRPAVTAEALSLAMASLQPPTLVRPAVVLFGDSLSQYAFDPEGGWGAALAHHLQRRVDVLNCGLAGYNSRWALKAFKQVLKQLEGRQVLLLTIWLGANDAAIPGRSAEVQHVPVSEYRSNLASMVSAAQAAGIVNILLVTPPPVHDQGRVQHQQQVSGTTSPVLPNKSLAYVQKYAEAVQDLGKQLQLPVVELYHTLQAVPNWQTELLSDGLHLTPAGSRAVWEQMRRVLQQQLPQVSPESLPTQFPLWDQLDHSKFDQHWRDTLAKLAASTPANNCSIPVPAAAPPGATSSAAAAASSRGCSGQRDPISVRERPLVVLFGDSLSQYAFDPEGGWGAALAHHLQRRADVISRGHSGYNSRWGSKVFEEVLKQLEGRQVLLLTIWLGANDAAIPGRSAEVQHVPLSEYRSNLASMVSAAQAAGIANILLVTPPPVHDQGRVQHQQQKMGTTTPVPPDRSLQYALQYAEAVRDLGKQLQLPVVDLYQQLQAVPNWQTALLKDGLHFTPAGSRGAWSEMQAVLQSQLPQLSPESLPAQFPLWDEPDHEAFQQHWQHAEQQLQQGDPASS